MQIQIGSRALYNGITWSESLALLCGQTIPYNRRQHSTFPYTNYCGCGPPVLVLDVLLFINSNPIKGMDRPKGFQEFENPRFQDNRHMKVVRLSAPHTDYLYPPGNIPGTHFCYRLSRPQGYSAARGTMSMKNSSDAIRNRIHDLPNFSAVPHATVPPWTVHIKILSTILKGGPGNGLSQLGRGHASDRRTSS
jgi:hypothetical protein